MAYILTASMAPDDPSCGRLELQNKRLEQQVSAIGGLCSALLLEQQKCRYGTHSTCPTAPIPGASTTAIETAASIASAASGAGTAYGIHHERLCEILLR